MPGFFLLFIAVIIAIVAAAGVVGHILLVYYLLKWKQRRPSAIKAMAFVLFFWAMVMLAIHAHDVMRQDNDTARFEEIFGFEPRATDSDMISNYAGSGNTYRILMRADLSPEEWAKIMALPSLAPSDLSPTYIVDVGRATASFWWPPSICENALIHETRRHNGWRRIVIVECPQQRNMMFIIAEGRMD